MKAKFIAPFRCLLAIAAACLTGCTAFQGSAHLEDWNPVAGEGTHVAFTGLLLGEKNLFDPITRYVFNIHGMGSTEDTYNEPMLNRLVDEFGYQRLGADKWVSATLSHDRSVRGEGIRCRTPSDTSLGIKCLYDVFGKYKVDRFVLKQPAVPDPNFRPHQLVVYTYFWNDDLWRVQGEYLNDDIKRRRALINAGLKSQLVDQGLSDAAAYLGPMRSMVIDGIRGALCAMLAEASGHPLSVQELEDPLAAAGEPKKYTRTLRAVGIPAGSDCLAAISLANMLIDTEFSFVSHSLGSRMLLDALTPYAGDRTDLADPRIDNKLEQLSAQTRTFFMAANQLPLLGLGNLEVVDVKIAPATAPKVPSQADETTAAVSGGSRLGQCTGTSFFDCRNQGAISPTVESFKLDVVAFFDPDDILGFEPNSGMAGLEEGGSNTDSTLGNIRFVTVVHRNTPQWLWVFTNPVEAHDKELDRDSAVALIFCGAETEGSSIKPKPRMAASGKGCRASPR